MTDTRENLVNELAYLHGVLHALDCDCLEYSFPVPEEAPLGKLPGEAEAYLDRICLPQALRVARAAHEVQGAGIKAHEAEWAHCTNAAVAVYGALLGSATGDFGPTSSDVGQVTQADVIFASTALVRRAYLTALGALDVPTAGRPVEVAHG